MWRGPRLIALVLLILSLSLTLHFIWGNSLQTGAQSMRRSKQFERYVRPVALALPFPKLHTRAGISMLTRKLAHFVQFFMLGAQLSALAWLLRPLLPGAVWLLFLVALLVAFVDEGLQFFTSRSPSLRDVLIDGLGALSGLLIVWLPLRLLERRRV